MWGADGDDDLYEQYKATGFVEGGYQVIAVGGGPASNVVVVTF